MIRAKSAHVLLKYGHTKLFLFAWLKLSTFLVVNLNSQHLSTPGDRDGQANSSPDSMWLCSPGVHHPSNTVAVPWDFPFSWHCPWHHVSIWRDRPRILFERLLKLRECKCKAQTDEPSDHHRTDGSCYLLLLSSVHLLVLKNLILAGYNQFAISLGCNITILLFFLPLFDSLFRALKV